MPLKDCERTLKETFHLHLPLSLWFIVCGAVDSGQGFTRCKGLSTELHGCPFNEMAINKTLTEDTDRAEQLMRVLTVPLPGRKANRSRNRCVTSSSSGDGGCGLFGTGKGKFLPSFLRGGLLLGPFKAKYCEN